MSGIEVIGAVAASAQLAGYFIKIPAAVQELREHIQYFPGRIQSYAILLESLSKTLEYIKRQKTLNTHDIEDRLRSISEKIDHLNNILSPFFATSSRGNPKRYFRIPREKRTEVRIKECFATLEIEKSNLLICMSVAMNAPSTQSMDTGSLETMETLTETTSVKEIVVHSSRTSSATSSPTINPNASSQILPGPSVVLPPYSTTHVPLENIDLNSYQRVVDNVANDNTEAGLIGMGIENGYFLRNQAHRNPIAVIGPSKAGSKGHFVGNSACGNGLAIIGPADLEGLGSLQDLRKKYTA
ncbi:hypothetical protein EJ04DRAFT_274709 [Polyplosphaeria fusca]|uniref:Uncharacterized protein n=1 Tax=Polyplosphaeria fusca TaxID=682080 RepID=A0A9P4QYM6_9PLEO|nr:hypothetical protein EJ04DRAFT_274709 [Polyplosphaeria fusca]